MISKSLKPCNLNGKAALCGCLAITALTAEADFTIDGIRDTMDESYTERAVQTITAGWGPDNTLANLHSAQVNSNLLISIGGRVASDDFGLNAILLFIDSKSGGTNFIPNNLITTGGAEETINKLGTSPTTGLTFESGFNADYAIRIISNDDDNQALIDRYDFAAGTRTFVGDSAAGTLSNGFISAIRTNWQTVSGSAPYTNTVNGVEMSLNLPLLGSPSGVHTVKVMAILVNYDFDPGDPIYGSNQVLNPITTTDDLAENLNEKNFGTLGGTQTVAIPVNYTDTDSDDDGLLDSEETNDGIYISPTATGSNPLVQDTDGDTYLDGDEVDASALGYLSNPLVPNYADMAVPGNFNLPVAWQPDPSLNSPSTAMAQVSTDLSGQFQWKLDYKFVTSQLGPFNYKFTCGGSFVVNWGQGDAPDTVKRGGNNLSGGVTATGFHRFSFDQAALTNTFERVVYPDAAAFLSAYGLTAGSDSDSDGINNELEFTANTDPTNIDSDNDGTNDNTDPQPLLATRDVVFQVDMSVQIINGDFTVDADTAKVILFAPTAAVGEIILTDSDGDRIYTGSLASAEGLAATSYSEYKFFNTRQFAPNNGYEANFNRTLILGPANTTQVLPAVFFSDDNSTFNYEDWADQYDPNPGNPDLDPDGDMFTNHEEFLFGSSPLERTQSLANTTFGTTDLTLRWLERDPDGEYQVSYQLMEGTQLSQGTWSPSPVTPTIDANQTGVPAGYARKMAVVPVDSARKFVRVGAKE